MLFKATLPNLCIVTGGKEIKFQKGLYATENAREIELLRTINGVFEEAPVKPLEVEAPKKKK